MDEHKAPTRKIEYVPPSRESIQRYAQAVCEQLAGQTNDPHAADAEVVDGFAEFLNVLCRMEAKRLTKEAQASDTGLAVELGLALLRSTGTL